MVLVFQRFPQEELSNFILWRMQMQSFNPSNQKTAKTMFRSENNNHNQNTNKPHHIKHVKIKRKYLFRVLFYIFAIILIIIAFQVESLYMIIQFFDHYHCELSRLFLYILLAALECF